ncbi:MAG: flagellar motor protein MotB [Balneolia bacterium]|nr:flagellar motor protein MotB [Balneolia bacterium]
MGRSKKSSGNWLVTYSDLVTLLMVFFVLLYVLTPGIDQSVFQNFISYFQSSVGVMNQSAVISQQDQDIENQRIDITNEWIVVEDFLEQHGLSNQVEIEAIPEGIKITLSDSLTFNSGSSQILPMAELVLGKISEMINEDVRSIEVQGHTDNVPVSPTSYYRSNWHLGAARAVSVVEFLRGSSEFAPENFKASSFGEYRPIDTNETSRGRRQNRRVEIYFLYEQLAGGYQFLNDQQTPVPLFEPVDFGE